MHHHYRKDNRVAEYFCVSGLDELLFSECLAAYFNPNDTIYKLSFEPKILQSYPLSENNPSFPEGIEYFCFPDGLYLRTQKLEIENHSFIHTSEDGSRLIGCTLVFYEELESKLHEILVSNGILDPQEVVYAPKAICVISQWPFITAFKTFLLSIFELSNTTSSIPLERYICNFIDDVPIPPPGKVDVNYFIGDISIKFQCPPINEPNVWTGFPLRPLFSKLSVENVCAVFALLLVERQIIFVSDKYDSLTLSIAALTSLLYPFHWVQALIPILPKRLLTALNAPFPFIFGIHQRFYEEYKPTIAGDTARVFLDQNSVDFGSRGPAPPLPEKRLRKLLAQLKLFVPKLLQSQDNEEISYQESAIREAFLKFFVAIFKDYKRYLVYPSSDKLDANSRFLSDEFLINQPAEWKPFLQEIFNTQLFSEFVDERIMLTKLDKDVIFFDESIDAKLNRYTFRFHSIDTPFLQHPSQKHLKTYVPPSPSLQGLSRDTVFHYESFPRLNSDLFVPPRNLTARFPKRSEQLINMLSGVRLKRKNLLTNLNTKAVLSGASCVFSSYLVCLCRLISLSVESISIPKHRASIVTTKQLLDEYNSEPLSRVRESSVVERLKFNSGEESSPKKIIESARLALKVVFEVLNSLIRLDYTPDEVVFRCIAEACADLKDARNLIDLIVFMDEEGFLPDHHIKHALVRSLTPSNTFTLLGLTATSRDENDGHLSEKLKKEFGIEPAEVWNFENWATLRRQDSSLLLRSSFPPQTGGTPRCGDGEGGGGLLSSYLFPLADHHSTGTLAHELSGSGNIPLLQKNQSTSGHHNRFRKDKWSMNTLEGFIPALPWRNMCSTSPGEAQRRSYAASRKLHRLVRLSEDILLRHFPNLVVDIQNSNGMQCPGTSCAVQRPLSLSEIHQGWESYQGDANKYTTKCIYCGREFIPRFSIQCTDLSDDSADPAPSGELATASLHWFELLSPWVLHKEVLNIIFEDGIAAILQNDFKVHTHQKAAVFWNMILFFRLRGLPFSFLLTNASLLEAFPLNDNQQNEKG